MEHDSGSLDGDDQSDSGDEREGDMLLEMENVEDDYEDAREEEEEISKKGECDDLNIFGMEDDDEGNEETNHDNDGSEADSQDDDSWDHLATTDFDKCDLFLLPIDMLISMYTHVVESDEICKLRDSWNSSRNTFKMFYKKKCHLVNDILHRLMSPEEHLCLSLLKRLLWHEDFALHNETAVMGMVQECDTILHYLLPLYKLELKRCSLKDGMRKTPCRLVRSFSSFLCYDDEGRRDIMTSKDEHFVKHALVAKVADFQVMVENKKSALQRTSDRTSPSIGPLLHAYSRVMRVLYMRDVWKIVSTPLFSSLRETCLLSDDPSSMRYALFAFLLDIYARSLLHSTGEAPLRCEQVIDRLNELTCDIPFIAGPYSKSAKTDPGIVKADEKEDRHGKGKTREEDEGETFVSRPFLVTDKGDNDDVPNFTQLNRHLDPSFWNELRTVRLEKEMDNLFLESTRFCSWMNRNKKNRQLSSKRCFLTSSSLKAGCCTDTLGDIVTLAEPYEVMRCFHLSPVLLCVNGTDKEDARARAKDMVNACILVMMLSCVRNVTFLPVGATSCRTMIVASGARTCWTLQPFDMNIVFTTESPPVLSKECLDRVLVAIQKKETVFI